MHSLFVGGNKHTNVRVFLELGTDEHRLPRTFKDAWTVTGLTYKTIASIPNFFVVLGADELGLLQTSKDAWALISLTEDKHFFLSE
jgi:hypothetical protein